MESNAFITRCVRHCVTYFEAAQDAAAEGRMVDSNGSPVDPYYPSILLVCETPSHFAAELIGGIPTLPKELKVIRRKLPSLEAVFGLFHTDASRSWLRGPAGGADYKFANLALLCQRDTDMFEGRYPELSQFQESVIIDDTPLRDDEAFHAISVPSSFKDVWLNDCLTVNSWKGQVRARYFQSAWITERSATSSELKRRLEQHHPIGGPDTKLLTPSTSGGRSLVLKAANFASLAAIDRIGETTITRFLEMNEEILLASLGGVKLIAQPLLPWLDGNPDPDEEAIQPDFLLIDDEEKAHLCEVKLPLLGRTSLTTGGHRQRKFISPVTDGVAQLANYKEYFSFEVHNHLLYERHGVLIDSPRSILLIGSEENYDEVEVAQAQRMLQPFELIDYDTVRALFLTRSGYLPSKALDIPKAEESGAGR
jgi:hypothetical protein